MKRKQFIKGSVVLSLFCAGVFAAIMLVGQQSVSAQPEVLALAGTRLLGHQWSSEQKKVWNAVEKLWELFAKEDLEGCLSCFHPDFRGWYSKDTLPRNKTVARKWSPFFFETTETLVHELNPLAIDIYGNVAFTHYFYKVAYKDAEGKHKLDRGRWTDIYVKEGDKWLLICDHGGPTSEE